MPQCTKKNIVKNAVNSKNHTTLLAAVEIVDLVEALSGEGPFTVFASEDSAFNALPEEMVRILVMLENKATSIGIFTYHMSPKKYDAANLMKAIEMGNGKTVVDAQGGTVLITIPDICQSNGVIHSIDTVSIPSM
jgi:uncharacterized surface protein with fasciclin (FAS1) repeats